MQQDIYGQMIFTEDDLCDIFLTNTNKRFTRTIITDKPIIFDLELGYIPKLISYEKQNLSIEEFDRINQNNWHMPVQYKKMDIAKFILDRCSNDSELQRAGHELLLFQERNLFDLLRYLKYLVDIMRENKIVWGVGRGSSTASFVLYLLGVHKINSLYYDLSIDEFLK